MVSRSEGEFKKSFFQQLINREYRDISASKLVVLLDQFFECKNQIDEMFRSLFTNDLQFKSTEDKLQKLEFRFINFSQNDENLQSLVWLIGEQDLWQCVAEAASL